MKEKFRDALYILLLVYVVGGTITFLIVMLR